MATSVHSSTVPARAALAGNPSDAHGGAVVATVVRSLAATVSVSASGSFEFGGCTQRFATAADVAEWIGSRPSLDGDHPLMHAAVVALHRRFDADLRPHRFAMSTTIPRSVGLAGSSAIVIATIATMVATHPDDPWARELVDHPELVASLALEAERDILAIAAGLQDRVVQTLGGTVAMEFGAAHRRVVHGLEVGSYRSLGPLPAGLFVAYRADTAGDSGRVHAGVDGHDPIVAQAMRGAADAARAAAEAIERRDPNALGAAMDATFDHRAVAYPLDPAHVEMVDVARANGGAANSTGSGGSIIVLAPDHRAAAALDDLGCTIVAL